MSVCQEKSRDHRDIGDSKGNQHDYIIQNITEEVIKLFRVLEIGVKKI